MAFTPQQNTEVQEAMEHFLQRRRPAEHIRPKLDYAYRIEGQSVIIYSIRPRWNNPTETIEEPIAKTTYVQKTGKWKVYWMRGNLKWYAYDPRPEVRTILDFARLVDEDRHFCFFG